MHLFTLCSFPVSVHYWRLDLHGVKLMKLKVHYCEWYALSLPLKMCRKKSLVHHGHGHSVQDVSCTYFVSGLFVKTPGV